MPDTTWPIDGHPPGSSRDSRYIPVSMSPVFLSTRHQRFAYARLPDPYLTHQVRLFPHRSRPRSSAKAPVGGLKPPPARRLRRAYLHLPRSTASRNSAYIKLLSAFVTHTCGNVELRRLELRTSCMPCDADTGLGEPGRGPDGRSPAEPEPARVWTAASVPARWLPGLSPG